MQVEQWGRGVVGMVVRYKACAAGVGAARASRLTARTWCPMLLTSRTRPCTSLSQLVFSSWAALRGAQHARARRHARACERPAARAWRHTAPRAALPRPQQVGRQVLSGGCACSSCATAVQLGAGTRVRAPQLLPPLLELLLVAGDGCLAGLDLWAGTCTQAGERHAAQSSQLRRAGAGHQAGNAAFR